LECQDCSCSSAFKLTMKLEKFIILEMERQISFSQP
jgi:hypothetical protein